MFPFVIIFFEIDDEWLAVLERISEVVGQLSVQIVVFLELGLTNLGS